MQGSASQPVTPLSGLREANETDPEQIQRTDAGQGCGHRDPSVAAPVAGARPQGGEAE